ncbi:hypothetical protein K1719_030229 [Acacia pycnantha]|nr:hypothetical protein K1719_030229 [Acacia pycnantha]
MLDPRLQRMLGQHGSISVVDMRNDFYVVKFSSWDDYNRALSDGPVLIADHYLTVREWKANFNPITEEMEEVLVWTLVQKRRGPRRVGMEKRGRDGFEGEGSGSRFERLLIEEVQGRNGGIESGKELVPYDALFGERKKEQKIRY